MRRGQKEQTRESSKSDKDKPQKIRNELTDEQKREIKEAFSTFEKTGLEAEELRSAMQALGFDAKNPDVQKMLDKLVELKKYHLACFLAVLISSGLRRREILQLKLSDFDDNHKYYKGMFYKTDKIRGKGRGVEGIKGVLQ